MSPIINGDHIEKCGRFRYIFFGRKKNIGLGIDENPASEMTDTDGDHDQRFT